VTATADCLRPRRGPRALGRRPRVHRRGRPGPAGRLDSRDRQSDLPQVASQETDRRLDVVAVSHSGPARGPGL